MRFLISFSLAVLVSTSSPAFGFGKFKTSPPKPFENNELSQVASASYLGLESGKIILDNDESFEQKIDAIRRAKNQEIRAIYYIYSDDESSSVFTKELIKAAAPDRNNTITLMVDYLTNYKSLDLFAYMQAKTNNRIQVRLYGRPTRNILKDAVYMTMQCPNPKKTGTVFEDDCKAEKVAALNALINKYKGDPLNLTTPKAGLFISGIMAKSPDLSAQAMIEGQQIDLAALASGANAKPMSKEDKEGLKKLLKLYWNAKVHKSIGANIKLWIAGIFYAKQVRPLVSGLNNVFPFGTPDSTGKADEWEHISDYTHHKLLLITNKAGARSGKESFQLGGRNMENSYNMRPNKLLVGQTGKPKYVFMDTDFYGQFANNEFTGTGTSRQMAEAYDRIWNFSEMVATIAEIRQHAPNDTYVNMARAKAKCKLDIDEAAAMMNAVTPEQITAAKAQLKADKSACIETEFVQNYQDINDRYAETEQNIEENVARYEAQYLAIRDSLPTADPDQNAPKSIALDTPHAYKGWAPVFYLENLHFANPNDLVNEDQRKLVLHEGKKDKRAFEATTGKERLKSKFLHYALVRGLEHVCLSSAAEAAAAREQNLPLPPKKSVIIHNAYVIFPSNIAEVFAAMINGDLDCGRVNVRIITNSINTTDLNIINPFAKMGVHAMAAIYRNERHPTKGAEFKLYEYKDIPNEQGAVSLHSKVWILGDDVVIGSANADVRSYMMDTNNSVYIRGAREMTKTFSGYLISQMDEADAEKPNAKLVALTPLYAAQVTPIGNESVGQAVRRGYEEYLSENNRFLQEKIIQRWRLEGIIGADKVKKIEQLYLDLQIAAYRSMLVGLATIPQPSSVNYLNNVDQIEQACWVADATGEFDDKKSGEKRYSTSPGVDDYDREMALIKLRREAKSITENFDIRFQLL